MYTEPERGHILKVAAGMTLIHKHGIAPCRSLVWSSLSRPPTLGREPAFEIEESGSAHIPGGRVASKPGENDDDTP